MAFNTATTITLLVLLVSQYAQACLCGVYCPSNSTTPVICPGGFFCSCLDANLRLSPGPTSGRLEILHDNTWGTICDDGFGDREAAVACQSLGFSGVGASVYTHGEGFDLPIWLDDLQCTTSSTTLSTCMTRTWGSHDCRYTENVGVRCAGTGIPTCPAGSYCPAGSTQPTLCPIGHYCPQQSSEPTPCMVAGTYCPVGSRQPWMCSAGYYCPDASTESTCPAGSYCPTNTQVAVACPGGSYCPALTVTPIDCPADSYCPDSAHSPIKCPAVMYCPAKSTAPQECPVSRPSCFETPLRLVPGPSSGRLEVQYYGEWGTVCNDRFDLQNAQVICQLLGFTDAVGYYTSGGGQGNIWMDELRCSSTFISEISDCQFDGWGKHDCGHREDVGIDCLTESAASRLTSGAIAGICLSVFIVFYVIIVRYKRTRPVRAPAAVRIVPPPMTALPTTATATATNTTTATAATRMPTLTTTPTTTTIVPTAAERDAVLAVSVASDARLVAMNAMRADSDMSADSDAHDGVGDGDVWEDTYSGVAAIFEHTPRPAWEVTATDTDSSTV